MEDCVKSTRLSHVYRIRHFTRRFISTMYAISFIYSIFLFVIDFNYYIIICNQFWCLLSKNGINFLLILTDLSYCCRGKCPELLFKNYKLHVFKILLSLQTKEVQQSNTCMNEVISLVSFLE